MKWQAVKEISVKDVDDAVFRVRRKDGKTVILEKQVDEWVNVTTECDAKLMARKYGPDAESRYLGLCHNDTLIAIAKADELKEVGSHIGSSKYKLVKAENSTYSFDVMMKV